MVIPVQGSHPGGFGLRSEFVFVKHCSIVLYLYYETVLIKGSRQKNAALIWVFSLRGVGGGGFRFDLLCTNNFEIFSKKKEGFEGPGQIQTNLTTFSLFVGEL